MKLKPAKIAIVQPRAYRFDEEKKNLDKAISYVREAAKREANFISFPECYPGPYSGPCDFTPVEAMCKEARNVGAYLLFGAAIEEKKGKIYNRYFTVSPKGEVIGEHDKLLIAGVDSLLAGGKNFEPGYRLNVVKTEFGTIGNLTCWEAWFPELARVLAYKGAEIFFFPTGNLQYDYRKNWKALLWSRAIENLAYSANTQNVWDDGRGFSNIFSPEDELGENYWEGTLYADVDLERIRTLRSTRIRTGLAKDAFRVIPGLLGYINPKQFYDKWF